MEMEKKETGNVVPGPRVFSVPIIDKSEKNNRNMPTVVFIVF